MNKALHYLLFCVCCIKLPFGLAQERADAFLVKAQHESYKVVAPMQYYPKLSVIVENHTLTPLRGKVTKNDEQVLANLMIAPGTSKSVEVALGKQDELAFVPQSPPFQKVVLKIGTRSYEIPPQGKN